MTTSSSEKTLYVYTFLIPGKSGAPAKLEVLADSMKEESGGYNLYRDGELVGYAPITAAWTKDEHHAPYIAGA